MTKRFTSLTLVTLFFAAIAFIVLRYEAKSRHEVSYPLQERKGPAGLSAEWINTKTLGEKLIARVSLRPDDIKTSLALATLYMQEARITGNYVYYDAAALKYVSRILEKYPDDFQALSLKSMIFLSQHHFSDGLNIAEKASRINPYNAFIYGLMVDANVELGHYGAAVENCNKMVSLRPDIRSYSRISYLREIHGDYPGAIEAMKMAVDAGGYGDEATEWTRIQLARLYENTGDLKMAEMHYTIALNERPDYAYAVAGLGHIAIARKDYIKAIALYRHADSSVTDYSLKEQLSQLYLITGNKKEGEELIYEVIAAMNKDAEKGSSDERIGHYADRELAYANLFVKEYDKALEHATAEYNRRPENIDANETMAWVNYKMGNYSKALPFIETALKTNCKSPVLLCHAGLIYGKSGNREKAKQFLTEALGNDPNIDPDLKDESNKFFKSLH